VNNQCSSLTRALYALKGEAQEFRTVRLESGYSGEDVGQMLSLVYGEQFSGRLLRQFEQLQLPLCAFLQARPAAARWLETLRPGRARRPGGQGGGHWRQRRRTKIDRESRRRLEAAYLESPKPSGQVVVTLASNTGLDRDVVRVWFANRRQKQKRQRAAQARREELALSFPGHFLTDLYDTFKDNDNPEEFDEQISDFDENLNRPEEARAPAGPSSVMAVRRSEALELPPLAEGLL
jgi:hypothetical protein